MLYLYVKAFHIIFMVTWFAGIFYLPRLFVYHSDAADETSLQRFCIMERKLFWFIMTPGAVLTVIFGLWLLEGYAWAAFRGTVWLPAKLGLVACLIIYHIYCGVLVGKFAARRNRFSHRWYRVFNEVPTLLLLAIVWLVVVKPL